MDEDNSDFKQSHKTNQSVSIQKLIDLGVLYWRCEGGVESKRLQKIRKDRDYKNHDFIEISPSKLPNYDDKIKKFFDEHLHDDEEIRYILAGSGYFDVRDCDRWIRVFVEQNDLIILPAGIYHRFTLDTTEYIHVMRLFKDEPVWTPYSRSNETTDSRPARSQFVASQKSLPLNGNSIIYDDGAPALAHYPHMRIANGFVYMSGLSSRRPDGTHLGSVKQDDGSYKLSIEDQTIGCIENASEQLASIGLTLNNAVDCNVFLTDMANFGGYNSVYNRYFDAQRGPTRTTVAVKQLPHPNLLIEMKFVFTMAK